MQLFSATTLLLASIVGNSLANPVCDGGITINSADGSRSRETLGCSGKCKKLKKVKGTGRRKLEAEERMLEVTLMKPADGATLTQVPILFEIGGLSGTASLELSREGCETIIDVLDIDEAGMVSEYITPTPTDCIGHEGDYTWVVKVVNGDEETQYEGGTFTYKIPAATAATAAKSNAREGPIQTNSGSAGGAASFGPTDEGPYEAGGQVQTAVGRIMYTSDDWDWGPIDFACTGTVIKDHKTGRTLILTAAHCIWNDIYEDWVYDAIFIPNRDARADEENAADIWRGCDDDPCGCWRLSGGVVHGLWPDTPWPERLEYDYGFFVVEDSGSHHGPENCGSDALDIAVPAQEYRLGAGAAEGDFITGMGYSLEHNPDFRYCAMEATSRDAADGVPTFWMDTCGLTGGASGGPWMKDFDSATGNGTLVSVNSWSYGYDDLGEPIPGMGGPMITDSEFRCLINHARDEIFEPVNDQDMHGIFVDGCFDRPCIEDEEGARKLRGGRQLCSETIVKREGAKP